ncbi:mucin-2 [Drosophila montana]|uniref:mucin-2 n=1 Tax=Drosophila montana TaxID=40370 RepID=UPI00313E6E0F
MIVRLDSIFALLALIAAFALTHAHFPEYCAECEQEIWEQVPCSELSTTTILPPTTTASTPRPIITTTPSPTTVRPTVPSTLPWTTTRLPIITTPPTPYITTPSTFKKCYCECKLGCKEFCRKVSIASPKQQITQISSTGDYAPGGQIEYTHSHQRKYYPKYAAPSKSYKPYPVVYSEAAVAAAETEAASSPASNNINAPNYTLEELAHLLSTAYGTKKGYPASPPPPPPPPQQQPSVYYLPQPLVARLQPEYRQVISKVAAQVPRERVIIRTAAAAVGSGRAVAKAKTPYGEVVATSAPIYESTTSYPIPPPETPKSYPAPEPEPEPEPVPVPLPMPQTEAYPSQTEAYPDKSYETPESNSIKPESASSFDLAIDNYLKDFGYDNQVRDLGY